MRRRAGVDTALVVETGRVPGVDVVAFFNSESRASVAECRRGEGGEARLDELRALVDPDGAA